MTTFSANDRLEHSKTVHEALFCIFTKRNPTKYPDLSDMPGDRVALSEIDDLLAKEENAVKILDRMTTGVIYASISALLTAFILFLILSAKLECELAVEIGSTIVPFISCLELSSALTYWALETFYLRIVHRRIVKRLCKFHPSTLIDYIEQAKCEVNQEVNPDSQQAPPLPPRRRVLRRK